jgi:hypothetical protein
VSTKIGCTTITADRNTGIGEKGPDYLKSSPAGLRLQQLTQLQRIEGEWDQAGQCHKRGAQTGCVVRFIKLEETKQEQEKLTRNVTSWRMKWIIDCTPTHTDVDAIKAIVEG